MVSSREWSSFKISYIHLLPLITWVVLVVIVLKNLLQSDIHTAFTETNQENNTYLSVDARAPQQTHVIEYHLKSLTLNLSKSLPLQTSNNEPPRFPQALISKPNNTQYKHCISCLIRTSSEFKDIIWYQHLDAYGLELRYLSLEGTRKQITSHPSNQRFIIYPSLNTVEYFLCHTAKGFGNGLSVYWGVRSLAYWMNFNFKISCKSYWKSLRRNELMSAFLPADIAMDTNIDMDNKTCTNKSVVSFYPTIQRSTSPPAAIHSTSLLFMYYNPHFQQIMNYETMRAMCEYYHHIDRNQTIREMDAMKDTNDIVIHIRCGDVLQIMHRVKDWDYGFLTINHYKYVMKIGLQKAFGINWFHKTTPNTTVWILSQLTNKAARKGELGAMKDCDYLVNYIVDHGMKELFAPATVKIMYDTDVNDDYYRMLMAPLLFCSPSTYCLNAGITNTNGFVVIPNRGAWVNFFHLSHKNRTIYDADDEDFIVVQNSSLIPQNQLIIDTEKKGYHCNKIDNYKFNERSYNQAEYTHKLAEYLVSH